MTKRFPQHRQIANIVRNADLFFNEAHAYTKLLPRFGSIAPRCVYADKNDIIMEDLRAQGYVVCERRNLLDFQHSRATVKALAILHARSLSLKLKSPEEFEALTDPLLEAAFPQDDKPALGASIDLSFTRAIQNLATLENEDAELAKALSYLKAYENGGYIALKSLVLKRKEKYDVLTHGDAWNNNIVFKHDDNGHVIDVKLIDFQIMRHSSSAIDFHYFVYSSVRSSVIEDHYNDLVKTYHTALTQELQSLGANKNTLQDLSVDWFKSELKKMSLYGLFTSMWLVNAVLAEDNETIDMDTITPEVLEDLMTKEVPIPATRLTRMKFLALHYYRTYGPN